MAKKYSQLQIKILMFYRDYLKYAHTKPEPLRSQLQTYARGVIEKNRDLPKRNFMYIELLLRMEQNKFNMIKQSNVDSINFK
ncbi:hypothetical protein FGO68_gene12397 [Halteria grandinella]|uniref:Uncharacterized protein n=1 Tax=Halteria grandinella TaxID=5974 RepID=A0A8J8SVB6_HALGN|nr:hypothetical protein FGO68_gene12397 [Halteria grandinella]